MNIQAEKLGLIEWITGIDDNSIIEKLNDIRKQYFIENDWWDEISEDDKKSITKGLSDVAAGRVIPYSEVKKIYEKYL
jgi:predicted transcriptional regulator